MALYSGIYAVYERLASAKMNAMVSSINSHTHDGTLGVKVNFTNLEGTITGSQIPSDTITTAHIQNSAVTTSKILNGTITWEDLDTSSILIRNSKYAVYSP